jgi:hypothetical protein
MRARALRIGLLLASVVLGVTLLLIQGESPNELKMLAARIPFVNPRDVRYHPTRLNTNDLNKDPELAVLAAKLEKLASQIPFINPHDVVCHRIPHEAQLLMDDQERAAFMAFMDLADKADESRLWKLTAHPNARVRSLAIVGVYSQANPKRLPGIFDLIDDWAETFPSVVDDRPGGQRWFESAKERRRDAGEKRQMVGDIARSVIEAYLNAANPVRDDRRIAEDFRNYWAVRSNRVHCLSWFQLGLCRAKHGFTGLQPECLPAVQKLRERIDALEPPYRSWVLLALAGSTQWFNEDAGRPRFANSNDIARAGREIGRPALMDLFHGRLESDDPDLRIDPDSPFEPFPYYKVCRLVLSNATDIFGPEDADALLAMEQFHRERKNPHITYISPCWAIAAAAAAPKRSRQILIAALERFKDGPQDAQERWEQETRQEKRRELIQALWEHEGIAAVDQIKGWLRTDTSKPVVDMFFRWLHADVSRRPLLDAIISHDR